MTFRGERGQQGDHGQQGDQGTPGAEGERGLTGPRGSAGTGLQNSLRTLTIATVVLYATVIVLFVVGYMVRVNDTNKTENLAVQTTSAICALRADLQVRVDQTKKFIHEHPEGLAGIPVETLRNQMEGQERTIAALSTLPCPPAEIVGETP